MGLTRTNWRTMNQSARKLFTLFIAYTVVFLISSHECTFGTSPINDEINYNTKDSSQWSNWSEWSQCSRSCDGGISISLRKCISKTECVGNVEQYKICNMQPCPVATDFRASQCSKMNSKPYRDRFYEWLPYIDITDPCRFTCKAKGLNFVAKLGGSFKDGTRCRQGSLDMCVAGKCLSVGCDLRLGSLMKIDDCGICGGDGTSCRKYHYSWTHRYLTQCSLSCGGGTQTSNVICLNTDTNAVVDDIFCNSNDKPVSETINCNDFECPPTWIVDKWTECDKKCATGKTTRSVFCIMQLSDGHNKTVPDRQCSDPKPDTEMKCNTQECPQWFEGSWSKCSEDCGTGIQTRPVVCRNSLGLPSDECELQLKPIDRKNCSDISKCLHSKSNSQEDSPHTQVINKVTSEPSFIVGPWSSCNASCGTGSKKRVVECKIYLEFSNTEVSIPESQCPREKPSEIEICYGEDCENNNIDVENITDEESPNVKYEIVLNETSHIWRVAGFSNCSLACLGGTQETKFECVRMPHNLTVDPNFCDFDSKPDSYTRTCNEQPCLPKWNATDFTECSKECGEGGVQQRIVRCVHEVARGSTNVVVIPDQQCTSPMPSTKQACNQIDCPAKLISSPWSKDCGSGIKKRTIRCMKEFAVGGTREVSPNECLTLKKPKVIKSCNSKPCRAFLHKNFSSELSRKSKRNNNAVLAHKQEQVTLKVEGKAVVFEGSLVKLRCPEWKSRTNVEDSIESGLSWSKGNEKIIHDKRYHLFRNVLKIKRVQLSDTAVYKCWSEGDHYHSMFLHVLPKPANTSQDTSNLVLSDHSNQFESHTKNYYKNELDLSQEMYKYTHKNDKLTKHNLVYSGDKIRKSQSLDLDDSREVSHNRMHSSSSSSYDTGRREHSNELESHLNKKENFLSWIDEANLKDLKFNWITTEWSKCTIPCGGIGFKMRLTQCYVQLDNITQAMESSFCTDRGLEQPKAVDKCGFLQCSFWKTGQWSECDNCLSLHRGLQTRSVNCLLTNGTVVQEWNCSQLDSKPAESQDCTNVNCVAHWSTGRWSKCNHNGYRSRKVQCVWKVTKKPANSTQCMDLNKPDSVDKCEYFQ